MSRFGHADPVGNDNYNKILSGRRAAAVYGMLTHDAAIWEDLFSNTGRFALPAVGDRWGDEALQTMLAEVGQTPSAGARLSRSARGRSAAGTSTLACRSNPARCACRDAVESTQGASGSAPTRHTRPPARGPSAMRPGSRRC
jgi:hypothetical protein